MMRPCSMCGAPTAAIYRLCQPCLVASTARDCAAQGVEFYITDPVRLDRLARIVRAPITTAAESAA